MLDTPLSEIDIIRAAQAGDGAATTALLEQYSPALRNATRRFSAALGAEDASQEALCAFLECLRDFDPDGDLRLVQVFGNRVLRALGEAAAGEEPFRIPPREYRRYLAAIRDADGDVGLALSRCDGGKHGLTRAAFLSIFESSRRTGSLDEMREFNHGTAWQQPRGSIEGTNAESSLDVDFEPLYPANPMFRPTLPTPSEVADCQYALSVVDDRERMVCRYAYGFAENRPLSDAEIAEAMPIPTERGRVWTRKTVNDVRNKAIVKMRAALVA